MAVKVTGEPPKLELVALSVFAPAAVPRVQLPTVAIPEASMIALSAGDRAAAQLHGERDGHAGDRVVVVVDDEHARRDRHRGSPCTVWPLPAFIAILLRRAGDAGGGEGHGRAGQAGGRGRQRVAPTVVPSVQRPTVGDTRRVGGGAPPVTRAAAGGDREGDGDAGDGVAPGVGDPDARVDGDAVAGVADWPSPALSAMVVGRPNTPVAVNVTGEPVTPAEVAGRALAPAAVPRVQLPTVAMPSSPVRWRRRSRTRRRTTR